MDRVVTAPAPAPWDWTASTNPGGSARNVFNVYITDANGRKIAAVWGKAEEKEATVRLMVAAPAMLAALRPLAAHAVTLELDFTCNELAAMDQEHFLVVNGISVADCFRARAAIKLAEGKSP